VPDFERLTDVYRSRVAAAELAVVEWRWTRDRVSLAHQLIPAWEQAMGYEPLPVRFLRRPPRRVTRETLYGFSPAGDVVVQREHGYRRVLAEVLVAAEEGRVEATRYGHYIEGDPAAKNVAVIAEWMWTLLYADELPVAYVFHGRDGAEGYNRYEYDTSGRLTTVIEHTRLASGEVEEDRLTAKTSADGQIIALWDKEGAIVYPPVAAP
jgi:hypothetical protein